MAIGHGEKSVVKAGPPAVMRVSLDILIVHKERVFQKQGVWFYVYDGSLPDAMLSDTMLNSIPCTSHPGETLIDTRARESDLPILIQQMEDYNGIRSFKINVVKAESIAPPVAPVPDISCNASAQRHSAPIPPEIGTAEVRSMNLPFGTAEYHIARCRELFEIANLRAAARLPPGPPQSVRTPDQLLADSKNSGRHTHIAANVSSAIHPAHVDGPGLLESANSHESQSTAPPFTPPSNTSPTQPSENDRINKLLAEMARQRAALNARLGKPISLEALSACMAILDRYPENFRPPGPDPCKLGIYRIALKDNTKFHVALPRRVNPIMLAEIRRQVQELVAQGAIERCTTRPASIYAIVMARRPNAPGKYRLCVDLVEGNSNTVPAPYAIPEVQQALDRLSGKSLYSTFDFSSWFHQFEIAEEDRDKVAFIVPGDNLTPPQIYRYKRVAFGLMNATYFCQRQLQEALEEWPGCEGIFPFVDDIVIATDDLDEMLVKLDSFMQFCKHHNIRLKKEKTELVTTAVKHVGFIISKEGQSLDPARVDSLLSIGAPKNLTGLKSLLGSFGFIRNWLADCAGTCAPLTDLMSGTAQRLKFDWGPEQEAALAALKLNVELAPAKMAPDYNIPFHVYVDASDVGVAAVLVQWRKHPETEEALPFAISHMSRRWAPREAAWEVSIREMYAIRYGLFKFREYLQGCPNVTVWSDHLNLVNGLWQHSSPKIQRWRLFMESMRPFYLKHVSGTDRMQVPADSLSRLHIANLFMTQTEEELDPETMRMMERGEGDDDIQMFGENYSTSIATQTQLFADISAHNASCATFELLTSDEKSLAALYGKGYEITRKRGSFETLQNPSPLQPIAAKRFRAGVGFDDSYNCFRRDFHENLIRTPTSGLMSHCEILPNTQKISDSDKLLPGSPADPPDDSMDISFVGTWDESGENRTSAPCVSAHVSLSSETQTLPQDYQDLIRCRAGSFSLKEIILRSHDESHPSFLSTYRRVIKAVGPRPGEATAWIKEEVKRHCAACLVCQKIQPAREKIFASVGTIRGRPFSSYAFDVVTLSEPDADGYRYILVCVDSWSRAVELFPLRQANSTEVFQCLNDVLCRWGTPHELRCDNAKAFTSSIVKALLSRSHVRMHLTAPYSHQSNGQVENCNRRMMDVLRALVLDDRLGVNTQTKWSLLLPQVRRTLMTRTVLQHGCTPNDLAYMNCPETEASIFDDEPWMPPREAVQDEPQWVAKLAAQHQTLIDICEEKQDQLFQKLAAVPDPQGKRRCIDVGDFVFVKMEERKHSKIQAPWAGPYQVIDFPLNDPDSPMTFLQHLSTKKTGLFHKNMLKFCDMTAFHIIEEAIPYAAKDSFEYEVAEVLEHRPTGARRTTNKSTPKSEYEFRCLWKDLVEDDQNPSWEPWTNTTLRECEAFKEYLRKPSVIRDLGANF